MSASSSTDGGLSLSTSESMIASEAAGCCRPSDKSWDCMFVRALCLDSKPDVCCVRSRQTKNLSRRTSLDETRAGERKGANMLRRFKIPSISIGGIFRRRPKSSESLNPFFGRELEALCQPDLPRQLVEMLVALYKRGPSTKQIFRRSAQQSKCQEAKQKLNMGVDIPFDSLQLTVTAALLKEFLRSLPDCLLTCRHYSEWISIVEQETNTFEGNVHIKKLVESLPSSNRLLLEHLICVLRHICESYAVNEMTSQNMAVCVGQCLLWPPNTGQQPRDLQSARQVISLVQRMIDQADEIFGVACLRLYLTAAIVESPEPHCVSVDAPCSKLANGDHDPINEPHNSFAELSCSRSAIDYESAVIPFHTPDTEFVNNYAELWNCQVAACCSGPADRDVESRNPPDGCYAADSGIVDDDSSVTEAPLSTSCSPLTGHNTSEGSTSVEDGELGGRSIDFTRETSQSKRDGWMRSLSAEQQIPEPIKPLSGVARDDVVTDSTSSDPHLVLRRNRLSSDLLCRQCGLRTLCSDSTKAKRRLSLPICIRICRCRSGMTANGSDLFPTRIIGDSGLLSTVFEDDALFRTGQEMSEFSRFAESLSVQSITEDLPDSSLLEMDNKISPCSPTDQCSYNVHDRLTNDVLLANNGTSNRSSCEQLPSTYRSPPSYAEAILHKALRCVALMDSEKVHTVDAVVEELHCDNQRKSHCYITKYDDSAVTSSLTGTGCRDEHIVVDRAVLVKDANFNMVESTNNEPVTRRPPPAYETAMRNRRESEDSASVVGQSDLRIPDHIISFITSNNVKQSRSAALVETTPFDACSDVTGDRLQPAMPVCNLLSAIESPPATQIEPNGPVSTDAAVGPCIPVTKNCDAVPLSSSVTAENCAMVANLVPDQVVSPWSYPEIVDSDTVSHSTTSAVSSRRQARAGKRRSVHSCSDTQIEAALSKSAKSKQAVVYRSASDCGSVVSRRGTSKDNKENFTIDNRLSSVCKRPCPEIESKRLSLQHSTASSREDSDSNNNCTDETSEYVEKGARTDASRRQVLKMKNHEWYQKLVKQYSEEEHSSNDRSESGLPLIQICDSKITREEHVKVKWSGFPEQRRSLVSRSLKSTINAVPHRTIVKQLTHDTSNYKERIKVTWSVSKLREKYNVNENTDP